MSNRKLTGRLLATVLCAALVATSVSFPAAADELPEKSGGGTEVVEDTDIFANESQDESDELVSDDTSDSVSIKSEDSIAEEDNSEAVTISNEELNNAEEEDTEDVEDVASVSDDQSEDYATDDEELSAETKEVVTVTSEGVWNNAEEDPCYVGMKSFTVSKTGNYLITASAGVDYDVCIGDKRTDSKFDQVFLLKGVQYNLRWSSDSISALTATLTLEIEMTEGGNLSYTDCISTGCDLEQNKVYALSLDEGYQYTFTNNGAALSDEDAIIYLPYSQEYAPKYITTNTTVYIYANKTFKLKMLPQKATALTVGRNALALNGFYCLDIKKSGWYNINSGKVEWNAGSVDAYYDFDYTEIISDNYSWRVSIYGSNLTWLDAGKYYFISWGENTKRLDIGNIDGATASASGKQSLDSAFSVLSREAAQDKKYFVNNISLGYLLYCNDIAADDTCIDMEEIEDVGIVSVAKGKKCYLFCGNNDAGTLSMNYQLAEIREMDDQLKIGNNTVVQNDATLHNYYCFTAPEEGAYSFSIGDMTDGDRFSYGSSPENMVNIKKIGSSTSVSTQMLLKKNEKYYVSVWKKDASACSHTLVIEKSEPEAFSETSTVTLAGTDAMQCYFFTPSTAGYYTFGEFGQTDLKKAAVIVNGSDVIVEKSHTPEMYESNGRNTYETYGDLSLSPVIYKLEKKKYSIAFTGEAGAKISVSKLQLIKENDEIQTGTGYRVYGFMPKEAGYLRFEDTRLDEYEGLTLWCPEDDEGVEKYVVATYETMDVDVAEKGVQYFLVAAGSVSGKLTVDAETYKIDQDAWDVERLIFKIGDVTLNSKQAIEAARKAYDELSQAAKGKISNDTYKTLTDAEKKLKDLEAAAKAAEEKKKADEEAARKAEEAKTAVGAKSTVNNVEYQVVADGQVQYGKVTNAKKTSYSVPATVKIAGKTMTVTVFDTKALKNCSKMKSLTIGANVTKIKGKGLNGKKKLKKVTIKSKKITKVDKGAFKNLGKGAKIYLPKSMKTKYKKIFKKSVIGSAKLVWK